VADEGGAWHWHRELTMNQTVETALLIDIKGLEKMLGRSDRSIYRDESAGRLPRSLKLGRSKRWRRDEIAAWVEAGCPDRRTWEAMRKPGRKAG
jgi:predicted DNA-binding transcriptional regulator AlpA